MSYHQPTDAEVRERIMIIKDEQYRHAFMFIEKTVVPCNNPCRAGKV